MNFERGVRGLDISDEDRAIALEVLGPQAFEHLLTRPISAECSIISADTDDNLQDKLSHLVDRPNSDSFSWNYAIFWQLSRAKSGDLVLGWGDGSCREPNQGESKLLARVFDRRMEDDAQQMMRKRILEKLNSWFGGSDEDNFVYGLDRVTDMEFFFF